MAVLLFSSCPPSYFARRICRYRKVCRSTRLSSNRDEPEKQKIQLVVIRKQLQLRLEKVKGFSVNDDLVVATYLGIIIFEAYLIKNVVSFYKSKSGSSSYFCALSPRSHQITTKLHKNNFMSKGPQLMTIALRKKKKKIPTGDTKTP